MQYSGGIGSWATAKVVRHRKRDRTVHLLFADTLIEDDDLYRFLIETAADIFQTPSVEDLVSRTRALPPIEDMPARKKELLQLAADTRERIPNLKWVAEGRDPWELFFDRKFLGNNRVDLCSETLKRNFLRKYMETNYAPSDTVAYIGIDWTEVHRLQKARPRWAPWVLEAPLCDPPYRAKNYFLERLEALGIQTPRLYGMGFPHNNCGSFCVKAGQSHFGLLLERMPERFDYHARKEQEIRETLGKDVAILKDRRKEVTKLNDGKAVPLTLVELRNRLTAGQETEEHDWGGCGCAL